MSKWIITKAGSFKILNDVESNSEIGQLTCTNAEAQLITSAPDMLKQLEEIVEGYNFGDNIEDYANTDIYHMVMSVRNVIKKAKGEL